MLALILAIAGAAAGFLVGPKYVRNVPPIALGAGGALVGLLVGANIGWLIKTLILMAIGAGIYLFYMQSRKR